MVHDPHEDPNFGGSSGKHFFAAKNRSLCRSNEKGSKSKFVFRLIHIYSYIAVRWYISG